MGWPQRFHSFNKYIGIHYVPLFQTLGVHQCTNNDLSIQSKGVKSTIKKKKQKYVCRTYYRKKKSKKAREDWECKE